MSFSELSGVGAGFRPPHYQWVLENRPRVSWFEIISENFIGNGGRPRRILEQLRSRYPIAAHGVSLSIASTDPLNEAYLSQLRRLFSWLEPAIVSDHLCWTRHHGVQSHDLLPIPYTREALEFLKARVHRVQETLGRRLVLENPSCYVQFAMNEMSEADFLKELSDSTGCGLLLDLNNVFVNSKNLGWSVSEYFDKLRPESIAYFHLAGHSVYPDLRIDTHDEPVPDEVWALFERATKAWPGTPALVEWDGKIPEFERLQAEIRKAEALQIGLERPGRRASAICPTNSVSDSPALRLDKAQAHFLEVITSRDPLGAAQLSELGLADQSPVSHARGMEVYHQAYFLRIRDCLAEIFPTLRFIAEEEGFDELVAAYLENSPPTRESIKDVGEKMPIFLRSSAGVASQFGVPSSALADLAALEWAREEIYDLESEWPPLELSAIADLPPALWDEIGFKFVSTLRLLDLSWDIGPVWESVQNGEVPRKPKAGHVSYLVYRSGEDVLHRKLEPVEARLLAQLLTAMPFKEACQGNEGFVDLLGQARFLMSWVGEGLVCGLSH